MQDKTGMVFRIQRFSVHDGPGIRTTVFLKGCNLHCQWCHNPECYILGGSKSAFEVIELVKKDINYYANSGGGLTVSGGEPLLQAEFVRAMFEKAKAERIHTALDTAGCVTYDAFGQVLPYTDLILLDLKIMDKLKHQTYTGVSNQLILENAKKLMQTGIDMYIRVPVIAGVNDTKENMEQLRAFIEDAPSVKKIDLLPYHSLGLEKGEHVGVKIIEFQTPDEEKMKELEEVLSFD